MPPRIPEPGALVTYQLLVANVSETGLTLTGLQDNLYGNLDGKGNCSLPQSLVAPNLLYLCSYTEEVSGQPGDVITNRVVGVATDFSPARAVLTDTDTASVTITDVPADIVTRKVALPDAIFEPGGTIDYRLGVQNISAVDTVTVTSLDDNLAGVPAGDCVTDFSLAPGELYTCTYPGKVSGNAGDARTNTVTVSGVSDDGEPVTDRTAASVFILGAAPAIEVRKVALPTVVLDTGGPVTFRVAVLNTSSTQDPVTLTSLVDSVYGDLLAEGLCPAPTPLAPGESYLCDFTVFIALAPGVTELNTVTAVGEDDDGLPVQGGAQASVTVRDRTPSLEVRKTATPGAVSGSGGTVRFEFTVSNISPTDSIELATLVDSSFGDLDGRGDCSVPQNLAPGEVYACSFEADITGVPGQTHRNIVLASGTSDDGDPVVSGDNATVQFLNDVGVPVPVNAPVGLAILLLLITLLAAWQLRRGRR